VLLLRKVARAMGVAVESLVREAPDQDRAAPHRAARPARRGQIQPGRKLAASLGVPFIELDREVEREAGAKLGEVFAMYGQEAYRRFERRALERVLRAHDERGDRRGRQPGHRSRHLPLLLDNCRTVWLKAKPEEHMNRVMAQGDMRPFKGDRRAGRDPQAARRPRPPLCARRRDARDLPAGTLKSSLDELKAKVKP
jgi:XRE family aerobic/anaerobic benzoate catabolism transcriptional regulator